MRGITPTLIGVRRGLTAGDFLVEATHCPVCGYGPFEIPYPSYHDLGSSFDICPCCFCEYGYDDGFGAQQRWIDGGGPWYEASLKPPGWDLRKQLEHAVDGWHGFRCGFGRNRQFEATYTTQVEERLHWLFASDPRRRLSAVMVLSWLDDDRIDSALQQATSDRDEDVRLLAVKVIQGRKEYRDAGLR